MPELGPATRALPVAEQQAPAERAAVDVLRWDLGAARAPPEPGQPAA